MNSVASLIAGRNFAQPGSGRKPCRINRKGDPVCMASSIWPIRKPNSNTFRGEHRPEKSGPVNAGMQILQGDCLAVLRTLPARSIQTCITSPPYFQLRDYLTATWIGGAAHCDHRMLTKRQTAKSLATSHGHGTRRSTHQHEVYRASCSKCGAMKVDNQIGWEETPEKYVARLVEVFREVRRVLRDDGTLWLNLGDTYNNRARIRKSSRQPSLNAFTEATGGTRWPRAVAAHRSIVVVSRKKTFF
jgi:hypothetical protein